MRQAGRTLPKPRRVVIDKHGPPCTQLWGRHAEEDAFVVGTGTSLAGFDFTHLAGRLTIALNDALLCPGLDPAYHLFHDHGLWVRYVSAQPHPRTWHVVSKHAREQFMLSDKCTFKARVLEFAHAGSPREVDQADASLYVDRTIATSGTERFSTTRTVNPLSQTCFSIVGAACALSAQNSAKTPSGAALHGYRNIIVPP